MEYTIVKVQELLAALKPSQFRPFKDAILKKEFKKYLNHIFKDRDRIYLPFEMENTVKVPRKIEDYLSTKNLEIVDYKAGLAKNKEGKLAKIGKALNKDEEGKQLLDLFNTSRSGVNKKDSLMIVISRHPYDIAGMSTGRGRDEPGDSKEGWGWSSCMNLRSGESREYVHKDIENGTLIAYVINSDEKSKNINKPISRILMKQYINIANKKDIILFPGKKVYGENVPGFKERLIEWLKTFQEFKGTYGFNTKLYFDDGEEEDDYDLIGLGDKNSEITEVRSLYYKNHPGDIAAKYDKAETIREDYYRNNLNDKEAKNDTSVWVRYSYYENHPEDEDAKYDKNSSIKDLYYKNHPEEKP